jgi:hypothetical protein
MNLAQYPKADKPSQHWELVPVQGGFKIRNRESGLVANIAGGSKGRGAGVIQYRTTNGSGENETWRADWRGSAFSIASTGCDLIIGVAGANEGDGAGLCTWDYAGTPEQLWTFVRVDRPTRPTRAK